MKSIPSIAHIYPKELCGLVANVVGFTASVLDELGGRLHNFHRGKRNNATAAERFDISVVLDLHGLVSFLVQNLPLLGTPAWTLGRAYLI